MSTSGSINPAAGVRRPEMCHHQRHRRRMICWLQAQMSQLVSPLWTSPTRSYNQPLHLPLLMMPAAEMKRQLDGNSSPQKNSFFRVPAEEVSRSCGGIRDSSSEPQGRRSRGRHQTAGRQRRRLRSARLCSPIGRTVGGKKGELRLIEQRRVKKSYIIGGRRLWSAGPCSPATRRPGGDRKNQ